jgi:hypothetical protein
MFALQAPLALALAAVTVASPIQPAWDDPRPPLVVAPSAVVGYGHPVRLVQSTGNLYWTDNSSVGSRTHSVVYRNSKPGGPSQKRAIYTLNGIRRDFGAVAFARGGKSFRFWVVVNDRRANGSSIRQFAGPDRRSIASPKLIGSRDLVTNGRQLFWADAGGVRRVSVSGGRPTTLFTGKGIRGLALAGNHLYFAQGKLIYRTNVTGPPSTRLFVRTAAHVNDLHGWRSTVFYGLSNASVWSRTGASTLRLQPPRAGYTVSSVSHDGRNPLWSTCTSANCTIRYWGRSTVISSGPRTHDVQGDSSWAFWADRTSVRRHTR